MPKIQNSTININEAQAVADVSVKLLTLSHDSDSNNNLISVMKRIHPETIRTQNYNFDC